MRLSYNVSKIDINIFRTYAVNCLKDKIKSRNRFLFLLPNIIYILLLISCFFYFLNTEGTIQLFVGMYLFIVTGICIRSISVLIEMTKLNSNAISENSPYLGDQYIELNSDGIKVTGLTSCSEIKWEGIRKYVENNKYYYMFIDNVAGFVIPKNNANGDLEIINVIKSKIKGV
jgi:hypothetical protein